MNQLKNDSVLVNQLYFPIRDILEKPSERNKFTTLVKRFIDTNSSKLLHNIPSKRMSYPMGEIERILKIKNSETVRIIKNAKFNGSRGDTVKSPNLLILALVLRFFLTHNDKKNSKLALKMYTIATYTHLFAKYYKFDPDESIMLYTLNRISNKFYFKKYPTVLDAIMATSINNLENMESSLLANDDDEIADFLTSHYSRLNNQMRKFANEYHIDYEKNNRFDIKSDDISADGEKFRAAPSNTSSDVNQKIIRVNNYISRSVIDKRIARTASSISKADPVILERSIREILDSEKERVSRLVSAIIIAYNNNYPDTSTINSKVFFARMNLLYSKSNIVQPEFKEFRALLEFFLNDYGYKYAKTSNRSNRSAFKKAIFNYFVLIIMSIR